jgi:hypothetical protein
MQLTARDAEKVIVLDDEYGLEVLVDPQDPTIEYAFLLIFP